MKNSSTQSSKKLPPKGQIRAGLRAVAWHLRPFKKQLILLAILGVVSAVANGFVPYITGRFFDALIQLSEGTSAQSGSVPLWAALLGAWALIQLVANNIDWIMDRIQCWISALFPLKLQIDGFVHLLQLPLTYHKNTHIQGDLQKLSMAGWRVSAIFNVLATFASQLLSICIGLILVLSINVTMGGLLLCGVLIYILLLIRIIKPAAAIDAELHKTWNDGWDDTAAAVNQIESVKQATAEKYEIEKVGNILGKKAFGLAYKQELIWSNAGFFQRTIVFCTQLAIFIFSVYFIAHQQITVGDLIAVNGYALMFFGPFVTLGRSWQTIQNGMTTAVQADTIFREPQEIYQPAGGVDLKTCAGKVVFDDVCFRYAPNQPEVLNSLDFSVAPGEVVAFVGESGVGKSTSISLISGYFFPTSGQVLVDGVPTEKINLESLRRHIGVVPQEVVLFNTTILENIKYGSPVATEQEAIVAAKEAHLDEYVETLPEKYNTLVGDRGIKLSVGQKQRVAIARAMLRKPAILILDEPTSALDAKTEKIVTDALEKLMKNRTTFIIAHRLSTVRKADKIFVFEKGAIVETGTHLELIARPDGVYKKLYEYQIGLH